MPTCGPVSPLGPTTTSPSRSSRWTSSIASTACSRRAPRSDPANGPGYSVIRDVLQQSLREALVADGVDAHETMHLERPARREHGDWSSNVAMATAKAAGRNPRELATSLVEWLNAHRPAHVERVELAGPGFVNFHLRPTWLHDVLVDVVDAGEQNYARTDAGGG